MRKKICFLVGYYPFARGGAEYQSLLIANYLKSRFDIVFISYGESEKTVYDNGFKIYIVPPLNIPGLKPIYFHKRRRVLEILVEENPQYVYHRSLNSNIEAATEFAKRGNSNVIWHIASDNDLNRRALILDRNFLINFFESNLIRKGISCCQTIIAQTSGQANALQKKFKKKSVQIYNFHPAPHSSPTKSTQTVKVLWVANLKPIKQPDIFVDLARSLQDLKNVEFIMVGRAGRKGLSAKKFGDRVQSIPNLKYLGEITIGEVDELLASSHLLVNTSKYEGFSNTFVQAWFQKVPVLSLNVDADNILAEHVLGYRTGSFEKLVEQTRSLIESPEKREAIGERASQFAVKHLSIDNLKIFDTLIK